MDSERSSKRMRTGGGDPGQVSDIRLASRQTYLARREAEQLYLLRQQVVEEATEERTNPDLSKKELQEFKFHREALRLAEARNAIGEGTDGYALPEDYLTEKGSLDSKKKEEALNRRHIERDAQGREVYITEQQQFENDQAAKAKAQISRAERVDEGDFEYVFDESSHIKFVNDAALRPNAKRKTVEEKVFEQKVAAAEEAVSKIESTRKSLPIYSYKEELCQAFKEYQVMVVIAETGSGKTTQIPQYLLEKGLNSGGMIGVTQPRRVAAMSVAQRVSDEKGCRLGQEVGYSIRFEDKTSDKTKIKFMTDGFLIREMLRSPTLDDFGVIMIDEAHERTLMTDLLLAITRDAIRARPDLKLVISSATLNAEKFSKYFDDCPIFNVPGRSHVVENLYTPNPEANYLSATVTTVLQVSMTQPLPGDILCFLTGQEEIEAAQSSLETTLRKLGKAAPQLIICPIYSTLPTDMQTKIFEPTPPGCRKVILATNIAETSLTVDGIVYVIDCGFEKQNVFDARRGIESLQVTPISKNSAMQRAGRAGRTGPGMCFHLYTKWTYLNELPSENMCEMQRASLYSLVLLLKSLGINDLINFEFLDPPNQDSLIKALEQLYALGALNSTGELTKIGRQMAAFPIAPMQARAILEADKLGCVDEVLSIAALLGEGSTLYYRPKDHKMHAESAHRRFQGDKSGGDWLALLNIWNGFLDSDYSYIWAKENFLQHRALMRASMVRDQLVRLCEQVEITPSSAGAGGADENNAVLRALTAGFFPNAARLERSGDSYRTISTGQSVRIHPSSCLREDRPRWIVYSEIVLTSAEFMRQCFPIKVEWLHEAAPHYYKKKDLEALGTDRKMPKGQGAASAASKF